MRLLFMILLICTIASGSCTKRDAPAVKAGKKDAAEEKDKQSKDGSDSNDPGPVYKDPPRDKSQDAAGAIDPDSKGRSDPGTPEGIQTVEALKLINNWSGKEDQHPEGLQFVTREFEEAPATDDASKQTFTALVAEYRNQSCINCHSASAASPQAGKAKQMPLDDHAAMRSGQSVQSWVTRAAGTVRSGRMPLGVSPQSEAIRTANADKLDALLKAWADANYPAQ